MTLSLATCFPAYSILEGINDMPFLIQSFGNNLPTSLDDLAVRTFHSGRKAHMQQRLHQRMNGII